MVVNDTFLVEFLFNFDDYDESLREEKIAAIQLRGNWDNYKSTYDLSRTKNGTWSCVVQTHAGVFEYHYVINGYEHISLIKDAASSAKKLPEKDTIIVSKVTATVFSVQESVKRLDSLCQNPDQYIIKIQNGDFLSMFAGKYARTLHSAKTRDLLYFKAVDEKDTPVIIVKIGDRLLQEEIAIPRDVILCDVKHRIRVGFSYGLENGKTRALIETIQKCLSKEKYKPMEYAALESFLDYHCRNTFVNHVGKIYVQLCRTETASNANDKSTIILVVLTDWKAAKEIEDILDGSSWQKLPVRTIRDSYILLTSVDSVNENSYNDRVTLGTCGGGSGITIGPILSDSRNNDKYMIQCAHGYSNEESQSCFYPPVAVIRGAHLEAHSSLQECHERKENQPNGFTEQDQIKLERMTERQRVLRRAMDNISYSGEYYLNAQLLQSISIGRCIEKDTGLDVALIKLHLKTRKGLEREFQKPPNALQTPARKMTYPQMPDAITSLSVANKQTIIDQYENGTSEPLGKLGRKTGFTTFKIFKEGCLVEGGAKVLELCPIGRSMYFDSRDRSGAIVDYGDSSAACFDTKTGEGFGMISAKLQSVEVAFMVTWESIYHWLQQKGYTNLNLAT